MTQNYRRYDPRLRNLVARTKDIEQFQNLNIPRSTLKEWVRNGVQEFITLPELNISSEELVSKNLALKSQIEALAAEQKLLTTTIRIFGFQIQFKRLPSDTAKKDILAAIKEASDTLPFLSCLKIIGLSAARYHSWMKKQVHCLLRDQSSCPQVSPTRLTNTEVMKIKQLYTSRDYAHISMLSLSWIAKKTGEVFASPSSWSKVIRNLGLKRNRVRLYPPKPKIGIRATASGQIWHLDLTILRLQDGTKAFVQCVIDNFSRYVLAWKASSDYGGVQTKALLIQALSKAKELGLTMTPNVLVDSGTENLNTHVDSLISENDITRTIAQIDIEFSNSMIEMLFHRMKHRYLFTIPLTNFDALKNAVDFFLTETNEKIPHAALKGATPLEMIRGQWTECQLLELKEQIKLCLKDRVMTNKSLRCSPCLA